MRFEEGERFKGFRIVKILKQGGMGEAYLAEDEVFRRSLAALLNKAEGEVPGRLVVLKCPQHSLAQDVRKRFVMEACVQASLAHPNICTLYSFMEDDEVIVLEFVEGSTLDKLSPMLCQDRGELLRVALQIADALIHAHSRRVVHRDLKPGNVMVNAQGLVKILDFGLAKRLDADKFTEQSGFLGTYNFASPEQFLDPHNTRECSDIFSFGGMLYYVATGKLPFGTLCWSPDRNPLPRFENWVGVEPWPELNRIVARCLQYKPEERYQSAELLRDDLQKVLKSMSELEYAPAFFDTSTLMEIIVPPVRSKPGRERAERARQQFDTHRSQGSAIASAGVLRELVERFFRLHFDLERGLSRDPGISSTIEALRREIEHRRAKDKGAPRPPARAFDDLTAAERSFVVQRLSPMKDAERLWGLASQLQSMLTQPEQLMTQYREWSALNGIEDRDAWILAEAYAANATLVYSEEPQYRNVRYGPILKIDGPNWYVFASRQRRPGEPPPPGPTETFAAAGLETKTRI